MFVQNKNLLKKIILLLGSIGPGLFLIGYNIGTGSLTTMAKSGAQFGMSLFWALLLSCLFTYILMLAYGKVTLVTGKTALYNIKSCLKGGTLLAVYIMAALIFGELLALMGIMGIVADLLQEGGRLVFGVTVKSVWIITVLSIVMYALLWYGRYNVFEKVLTFFVILMGASFLVVFFMVKPDFAEIGRGLVPAIPEGPGALGLIAAMAGTTCSAAVFIMRSTVVAEKGWTIENLKDEKKDAFVSVFMMLFLSGIIMAVSAGTLHVMGLQLTETIEMIQLFQPLGGKTAAVILILGIAGAGISTIFPIVLIAPWLISDFTGKPRDIHSPLYRILTLTALIFGFGMLFLEQKPPALMIFSQAFQACILPAVCIPVFLLVRNEGLMGDHKAKSLLSTGIFLVILYSFITTIFALIELL